MKGFRILFVIAVAGLGLIAAGAAVGQGRGIEMKERTKISGGMLSGATGWMARMAGMPDEIETETFLNAAATKKRVDEDATETSTIIDLENELHITLDHDSKTAVVKTFDELRAEFEAMMEEHGEGEEAEMQEQPEDAPEPPKMSISVEPTGRTLKHRGFSAEEFYQTITLESANPQEASMVFFSILYMTDEIDLSAMERFNAAYAEAMGSAALLTGRAQMSMQAMLEDPEMQEAFAEAKDANEQLGNRVAVYNKTYMVSVPPGKEFDRELAMDEKKEEGGGFGGFMKKAAQSANPMGGGEEAEDEEAQAEQRTSLEFETEYRDFEHKNPKDDKFEVPSKYRVEQG